MRALVFAALTLAFAGCPSPGGCPPDTISSASQCIPAPDMTALSDVCPTAAALAANQSLPPCVSGKRCFYPVGDGGVRDTECDCTATNTWVCLAGGP